MNNSGHPNPGNSLGHPNPEYDRATLQAVLGAVTESVGDGVVFLDGQAEPLLVSREACRVLDLMATAGGKPGSGLATLLDHLGIPAGPAGVGDQSPPGVVRREVELVGRLYELETRPAALASLLGRLVIIRDTTKERELDRLKSEFFANTSHELRTPLNAVIGFTELSLDENDGPLSEGHRHNLTRVLINARSLLSMINDLLDLAKLESFKMDVRIQRVDLHRVVTDSLARVSSLALEKDLRLEREIVGDVSEVYSDPEKLRKILVNLLSNAIKYTEKGQVRLEVRAVQDNQVEFSVRDTGIGIGVADLPHIFDRFRQVDGSATRKVGGAGLGLSLVRELASLLGGRVGVESNPGQGSTFTVTLPRSITHAMRRREDAS